MFSALCLSVSLSFSRSHRCEAAGAAGDKFKSQLTVGLVTLRELILKRSACRQECLRAVFSYTKEGMVRWVIACWLVVHVDDACWTFTHRRICVCFFVVSDCNGHCLILSSRPS